MIPTTGTSEFRRFNPDLMRLGATNIPSARPVYVDERDHVVLLRSSKRRDIGKEFRKLELKWKRDTRHISSPSDKYLHPSYARIIGLGRPAVPLILTSLRRERDDWFYALRAITGVNPVTSAMAGDMKKMAAAWVKWGAQEGLL